MALADDIGAVLESVTKPPPDVATAALEQPGDVAAQVTETAQPDTVEPVTETVQRDTVEPPAPPVKDEPGEPFQVAGMGSIFDKVLKRAIKNIPEKNTLPSELKDVPVQMVGKTVLARPATVEELGRLNTVFGEAYTKGINFPAISEAGGDLDLAIYQQQLKNANPELFDKAKRGTLNFQEMLAKAKEKDVDSTIYDWLTRTAGTSANGEDILAGMLGAVSLTQNTKNAFAKARDMVAGPEKDALLKRAAHMASMEGQLYANLSAAGSEAGRALYVLQQAQTQLGAGAIMDRASQISNLLGSDSVKDIEHFGIAYLAIKDPNQRAIFVKQTFARKSMDFMATAFINSILSGPVTHVVNVAGNAMYMGTHVWETFIAGGIGNIRSKITGNTDRVYAREGIGEALAVQQGFLDALKVAGRAFVKEEAGDLSTKLDSPIKGIGTTGDLTEIYKQIRQGNHIASAVNSIGVSFRMPGRFLLAEDEFFKTIGSRISLHKEAYAHGGRVYDEAIAAGKTPKEATVMETVERNRIMTDPPESVIDSAKLAAKEMTFQKDLEGFMKSVQGAVSHPILKLFVPFVKTPTNVIGAVFERTPLNLKLFGEIRAGGRRADIALSKLATGSMIMGTFAYMAATGGENGDVIINGSGPSDPKMRATWRRLGNSPYTISVKQDDGTYTSFTYGRFDPISGLLAMAADMAYYTKHESSGDVIKDLALNAAASITPYALQNPFLQGVSEFSRLLTISNPKEKAGAIQKFIAEKMTGGALSIFPTVSSAGAAIARYKDPTQRSTKLPAEGLFGEDPTKLPDFMQGFYAALQKAMARNAFFNQSLPPALNLWGEKLTQGTSSLWEFINPIRIQNSKFNTVDMELLRLKAGISEFPKKIGGVELNAVQYNKWIENTNNYDGTHDKMPGEDGYSAKGTLLYVLTNAVSSSGYNILSDEKKADAISGIVSEYRAIGKKLLFQDTTVDGFGLKSKIDIKGK